MAESKIDLTNRLRREGRWEEASVFKDETVKQLRAEGVTRTEASEKAWEAVALKYPPLEPAEPLPTDTAQEATEAEITALLEREDASPDLVRDILWAYSNLENGRAAPDSAPGAGAWALLKWARQYRARFFEQVLPKAMLANTRRDEEEHNRQRGQRQIEEIEEMLREFHADWERELLKNTPATVQEAVSAQISDWTRRFGLNLPADAVDSLQTEMATLAQECIAAAVADPGAFSKAEGDAATA
jgi:hypothetical protein